MHYKNGREVTVGDWVIGKTHNSDQCLVVGIVRELMPTQGPCNVRLHSWAGRDMMPFAESRDTDAAFNLPDGDWLSAGHQNYADAKELIPIIDGYRMVAAVCDHGVWNAPYLAPKF